MLDALLYGARDAARAAGFSLGKAECEIMDDGRPPPRCGNMFVSIHGGKSRATSDNQLHEYFDFSATLTMRVVVPLDRVGDQQIARNLIRVPHGERQGFNAKVEQLRGLLHMNWRMTVQTGGAVKSANDNLSDWCSGTVYGFCEPARYRGEEEPRLVGGEWFGAEPDVEEVGIVTTMRFEGARRFQPQTAAVGPFV